MDWDVTEVRAVNDHALWVRFTDGTEGAIKFLPTFFRGVFSDLNNLDRFKQVHVSNGVVTWPGNLDLAPDAMHRQIRVHGEWVLD